MKARLDCRRILEGFLNENDCEGKCIVAGMYSNMETKSVGPAARKRMPCFMFWAY